MRYGAEASSAEVLAAWFSNSSSKPCKIINGSLSREHEYRWQVQIRSEDDNPRAGFCGGSILNKNFVLTAAHCLCDTNDSKLLHPEPKGRILVAVGFYKGYGAADEFDSWKINYGRDVIFVADNGYFIHPDYDILKHFHSDIAILKLQHNRVAQITSQYRRNTYTAMIFFKYFCLHSRTVEKYWYSYLF